MLTIKICAGSTCAWLYLMTRSFQNVWNLGLDQSYKYLSTAVPFLQQRHHWPSLFVSPDAEMLTAFYPFTHICAQSFYVLSTLSNNSASILWGKRGVPQKEGLENSRWSKYKYICFYFALKQHAQFHHLVCVAWTFEGLLLIQVLRWAFTCGV